MNNQLDFAYWFFLLLLVACTLATGGFIYCRTKTDCLKEKHHYEKMILGLIATIAINVFLITLTNHLLR